MRDDNPNLNDNYAIRGVEFRVSWQAKRAKDTIKGLGMRVDV